MISTRYNLHIPFYILILLSVSFVLSLFAMQLFGGMLVILWMFESNSEKKKAIDSFIIAVLIYGFARLLSIVLSEYPELSIHALYKEALFFLSVFSIGFYFKVLDETKIKMIVYVFIAGAVINSLIGLVRFNLGIVERAESFTSGYTVFSGYLIAALGISFVLFSFKEIRESTSSPIIISVGIILSGIITSLGRANIANAVLIFVFSLIFKMLKLKQIIFALLIALAVSYISFLNNQLEVSHRIESPVQLSDRDILHKGAAEIIWQNPVFGFGPRTFKKIFPLRDELTDKGVGGWHNHILQIYFESGIVGLTAYLFIFFTVFKSAYKFLRRKSNGEDKSIVIGILLSTSALFLSAFFSSFIDSPVLSIVFAFLVSIMTAEIFKEKHNI